MRISGQSRTAARRLILRRLVETTILTSQAEALHALEAHGHPVTQATVSRDFAAIGARRSVGVDGTTAYRLAADSGPGVAELVERMRQFVVDIRTTANLVVVQTPPGAAHSVAVALDAQRADTLPGMLGTIAGDDTIFIATHPSGGPALASRLEALMEAGL